MTPAEAVHAIHADGFAVLRGYFKPERLLALRDRVDRLYEREGRWHFEPADLRRLGEPPLDEGLFDDHFLIREFFGGPWRVSESTGTRRIGPEDATHMRPLRPHLDAFFHDMTLTLNLWTPLQPCGDGIVPGLAVWAFPPASMPMLTGFELMRAPRADWNFAHFDPRWRDLCEGKDCPWFKEEFGTPATPRLELGDVIALTNWTLHGTGPGDPTARRANVELRFLAA